jgi:predicted ArsR family transcriptional regulator
MKKQLPQTSYDAYHQVTPEMLQGHYGKILAALKKLGTANYETIASNVNLDRHAVGRRLKEMEIKQWVHKPGTTSPTKSGRKAFNYSLTGVVPENILPQSPNPVGRPKKVTTVSYNSLFDNLPIQQP